MSHDSHTSCEVEPAFYTDSKTYFSRYTVSLATGDKAYGNPIFLEDNFKFRNKQVVS